MWLLTSVFGQYSRFSRCVFLVAKTEFQVTFLHVDDISSLPIVPLLKGYFFALFFDHYVCLIPVWSVVRRMIHIPQIPLTVKV